MWILKSLKRFRPIREVNTYFIAEIRKCRYSENQLNLEDFMKTNLLISARGQITLPADIRKKYKIGDGDIIILEERNGELVLKPAQVLEVEYYSDEQLNEYVEQDKFRPGEKEKLLKKLKRGSR
jgi:AbrB family looped-hinge helix DNA binding protein